MDKANGYELCEKVIIINKVSKWKNKRCEIIVILKLRN
jgi:hypothetical protein